MLFEVSNASATNKVTNCAKNKEREGGDEKSRFFHGPRVPKRFLLKSIFVVVIAILNISPVIAHTSLIKSIPNNSSILRNLPDQIELSFTDKLITLAGNQVNAVSVRDPNLALISLGEIEIEGNTISVPFADGKYDAGLYKIYFRVVSSDGHPVSGFTSFTTTDETTLRNGVIGAVGTADVTKNYFELILEQIKHHFLHILWALIALLLIVGWAVVLKLNRDK
jgi:methionine-rich copper-binding protein CopC